MIKAHIYQEQGYKQREIAEKLGVTERTVRNYLNRTPCQRKKRIYPSKLDRFRDFIEEIIESNPYYNCELLLDRMRKMGYEGGISILRDHASKVRRKVIGEAVMRFETEPGRQAQVDWTGFGRHWVDGRHVTLYGFIMTLGYSRRSYVQFTTSMKQSVLHGCHVRAFDYYGGAPHEILYDNMKTAFVCDGEGNFYPNRRLLGFARHYGFVPKRCMVRRPQTKGKVERFIGYVKENFWPRMEGRELTLDGLNEAALAWCEDIDRKPLREFQESRGERFEREKHHLQLLSGQSYDSRDVYELHVDRESCITFETNRYSVPPEYMRGYLTLKVDHGSGEAELFHGDNSIRAMRLAATGSRSRITTVEDAQALRLVWEKQRLKRLAKEKTRHMVERSAREIEIRKPAFYEKLAEVAQ